MEEIFRENQNLKIVALKNFFFSFLPLTSKKDKVRWRKRVKEIFFFWSSLIISAKIQIFPSPFLFFFIFEIKLANYYISQLHSRHFRGIFITIKKNILLCTWGLRKLFIIWDGLLMIPLSRSNPIVQKYFIGPFFLTIVIRWIKKCIFGLTGMFGYSDLYLSLTELFVMELSTVFFFKLTTLEILHIISHN